MSKDFPRSCALRLFVTCVCGSSEGTSSIHFPLSRVPCEGEKAQPGVVRGGQLPGGVLHLRGAHCVPPVSSRRPSHRAGQSSRLPRFGPGESTSRVQCLDASGVQPDGLRKGNGPKANPASGFYHESPVLFRGVVPQSSNFY